MPKKFILPLCIAAAVLAAGIVLKFLFPALLPFIIALLFSFLMEPIIVILQRKVRLPRGIATFFAMIFVFGGIGVVLTIVLLKLVAELAHLSLSLPGIAMDLKVRTQYLIEGATEFYVNLPPYVTSSIEQNITSLATNIQGVVTGIVNTILQYISVVPGTITLLLVSFIATYFLARDRHSIAQLTLRLIPTPWDKKIVDLLKAVSNGFVGYLRAQAILMSITTLVSIIGLYFIGAKYALTMGLLVGFMDLIPVLGPATIYLSWAAWVAASGDIVFAVKLVVLYGIIFAIRQLLEAKVVSASIGMHPLATLISMYAGLKLIGVLGLILGPILLIAMQATIKAGVFSHKK